MVSLGSTGLAIARPHRKGNFPADEFIPSELNAEGGYASHDGHHSSCWAQRRFSLENSEFCGSCDFQSRGTPRESPHSDYSEGNNTVTYPFCAVLQAFSDIMNE